MYKINTSLKNQSLKKLILFKFKIVLNNNNLFFNLTLNNFLCKYLSSKKYIFPFELFLNYFTYLFRKFKKSNLIKYSFIFEIIGSTFRTKKNLLNFIKFFLNNIQFKQGKLLFIEKTLVSFNGSTRVPKKRKTRHKKKVFKKKKWNIMF